MALASAHGHKACNTLPRGPTTERQTGVTSTSDSDAGVYVKVPVRVAQVGPSMSGMS